MILTGDNRSTKNKTCSRTTLSTTNHKWNGGGSNSVLRGKRPTNYRLARGTAPRSCDRAQSDAQPERGHGDLIRLLFYLRKKIGQSVAFVFRRAYLPPKTLEHEIYSVLLPT